MASAFEYMGYIKHWGSGILRVMQKVCDVGLPESEFLGGNTDLRINFIAMAQRQFLMTGL